VFDALPEVEARERLDRSVFDVCHVGVVLRALLFVHVVVAVATLFVAGGLSEWIVLVALGSGSALPGLLLWLLAACAFKRPLGALGTLAQAFAAVALGAACGLLGSLPGLLLRVDPAGAIAWLAPACAGAAFAGALFRVAVPAVRRRPCRPIPRRASRSCNRASARTFCSTR